MSDIENPNNKPIESIKKAEILLNDYNELGKEVDKIYKKRKTRDSNYMKNYCREWYQKNKDYHNKYCMEKVECECGDLICRSGMIKHKKSDKHFSNMYKKKI